MPKVACFRHLVWTYAKEVQLEKDLSFFSSLR